MMMNKLYNIYNYQINYNNFKFTNPNQYNILPIPKNIK